MRDVLTVDRTLVVMAKAPRLGAVKTRLAQHFSPAAVCDLYRCLLEDTVALARRLRGVQVAMMCPASDVEELTRFVGAKAPVVAQSGEGLAAGLTSVFAHFAADGRRVVAFNSDSPHLPDSVLEKAFEMLATSDLVAGPTNNDGGYYLVGAKAAHPGLFAGDGMGTTNALPALLTHAGHLGLSVALTDNFYDVDVLADLIALAEELRATPSKAPRTAAWLEQWDKRLGELSSNFNRA